MSQQISGVGIDLAKRLFHVVGMDNTGRVVLRKRLTWGDLLSYMAQLAPVVLGMEA